MSASYVDPTLNYGKTHTFQGTWNPAYSKVGPWPITGEFAGNYAQGETVTIISHILDEDIHVFYKVTNSRLTGYVNAAYLDLPYEGYNDPGHPAGTNLLQNPGFENGAENWIFTWPRLQTASYEAKEGNNSLIFVNYNSSTTQTVYQGLTLRPGGSYTLSYYIMRSREVALELKPGYQSQNWDGSWSKVLGDSQVSQTCARYVRLLHNFTLPATSTGNTRIMFEGSFAGGVYANVTIDDLKLVYNGGGTDPSAPPTSLGDMYIDGPVGYYMYGFADTSTSSERLITIPRGTKVKAYDVGVENWLLFETYGDIKQAYISKLNMSTFLPRTGTSLGTRYINVSANYAVNLFTDVSSPWVVRHSVACGTPVTVYDVGIADYRLVQSQAGHYGYCRDYYVAMAAPGSGASLGTKYVDVAVGSTMPVRSSTTPTSTILHNLARGMEVLAYDCSVSGYAYIRDKANSSIEGFCLTTSLSSTAPGSGDNELLSAVANTWSVRIWDSENRTGDPSFTSPSTGRMPFTIKEYGNETMYKTYHGFYPLVEKYVQKSAVDLENNGNQMPGQRIADIANFWAEKNVNKKDLGMGTDPQSQWCMWFANWMVGAAGLGQQNSTWVNDNNAATAYAEMSRLGLIKSAPVVGSIFFTKYDSPNVDHCGIVVSEPRTENGKTVVTVAEGDYQGQQVVTTRF